MAKPTLVEVFGTGTTQDTNTITIQKSALSTVGLTPSANNTAESILVALVKIGAITLTQTNYDANPDQSVVITKNLDSIGYRGDNAYIQTPYEIRFSKLAPSTEIDPDDY